MDLISQWTRPEPILSYSKGLMNVLQSFNSDMCAKKNAHINVN